MQLLQGHQGPVRCLAYSPDGSTLAAGDDQTVRLWDPAAGRVRAAGPERSAEVTSLAFRPDGLDLASGDRQGGVQIRDASTAQVRSRNGLRACLRPVLDNPVNGLAFSLGGSLVLSVAGGPAGGIQGHGPSAHQVAIWQLETGLTFLLAGLDEVIWGFGVDAEQRKLFLGLGKRYLAAWPLKEWWIAGWAARPMGPGPIHYLHHTRIAQGRPRYFARSRPRSPARPRDLGVSRDGRSLAAPWGRVIELWDAAEFRLRATLSGHDDEVVALAFRPDGRMLASASLDGAVRLWDLDGLRPAACYDWGIGAVRCLAFAPDGMTAAAGGDLGIVVWDVDGPGY